jgi:1,4-dihydroxy-6-naphthoate synthase
MEHMNFTLGFSPCPNDTYMFGALVNGWIDTHEIHFSVRMEDVETLNTLASEEKLDLTKMSFHRSLFLEDKYTLLSSGAALGNGCGPLLIAKSNLLDEEFRKGPVALPGTWTTAHLLFKIFYPEVSNKQFHPFHIIEDLVLQDKVPVGVIIHENRFTYESKGLVKILDLGEAWESKTGLPIPLGGIFASSRIPKHLIARIERLIRESIDFARHHPEIIMPYVRQYAQEMDEKVMKNHIDLYVNDFSLDLGEKGRKSVSELKKMLR